MEKVYFEDCQVGDRFISLGRTVTETDIVMFAALSGDWNPLHTNMEYAKDTAFGVRIAHGLLVLAISSGLMRPGEAGLFPSSTLALGGLEKVRFVAPTQIGDTLSLEGEVVKLTKVDRKRGLITASFRVKNQHGKNVMTYAVKMLAERRPLAGGEVHG
jgi:3-hydroxybutyryl-CoA dehydratase